MRAFSKNKGNTSSALTVKEKKEESTQSEIVTGNTSDPKTVSTVNPKTSVVKKKVDKKTPEDNSKVTYPVSSEEQKVLNNTVNKVISAVPPNLIAQNPTQNEDENKNENENGEMVPGVDYGEIQYEGTFDSIISDGSIAYLIFRSPDNLVVYDTKNLKAVTSFSLPACAGEIQLVNNQVMISYPDLKCIKVYNKSTLAEIKTVNLPNVVSSFCFDGDKVYYSEHYGKGSVYCTDLISNKTVAILDESGNKKSFSSPKLLLNKQKGLLYIGETCDPEGKLYYYNLSDLTLNSVYARPVNGRPYGMYNYRRTMFLVGDSVMWAHMRLDAANAANVIGQYGPGDAARLYYADSEIVCLGMGNFATETYQLVSYIENCTYIWPTDCAMVVVNDNIPYKFIIVIPY